MARGKSSVKTDCAWPRSARTTERRMAHKKTSFKNVRESRARRMQEREQERATKRHNSGRTPTPADYAHVGGIACVVFTLMVYVLW